MEYFDTFSRNDCYWLDLVDELAKCLILSTRGWAEAKQMKVDFIDQMLSRGKKWKYINGQSA